MRLQKITAVLLLFLVYGHAKSTHFMGSDMTFKCLGNNKYKITVTTYRDCRGISSGTPAFGAFAGNNGSNTCGSHVFTLTRTAITEVTTLCDTAKGRCIPMNQLVKGAGVERHIYEYIANFNSAPLSAYRNNSNCCEVTFYITECCRNAAITTGPANNNFLSSCTINFCNLGADCDNSPVSTNTPIFFACCNQPYRYNQGTVDSGELDSFSFEMTPAISGIPNTAVTYVGPWTYQFPVSTFCPGSSSINCPPNPLSNPPVGFYLDTVNGDMVFTPILCGEVAVIAIQVNEYRKSNGIWKIISRTRRDMQIIVTDCGNNNTPEITSKSTFTACPGDSICIPIQTKDIIANGQTDSGKLTLSWNEALPGARFTIADTNAREPSAILCWVVPNTAKGLLNFSIHARDNHCPIYAETYKGFSINVLDCTNGVGKQMNNEKPFLFPQPARSGQTVHLTHGNLSIHGIKIYTSSGRLVYEAVLIGNGNFVVPEGIAPGTYFLVEADKQNAYPTLFIVGE